MLTLHHLHFHRPIRPRYQSLQQSPYLYPYLDLQLQIEQSVNLCFISMEKEPGYFGRIV